MSIMWADKYKPDTFQNLNYHEDISKRLKTLASSDDFPHLLVYGPSGAGKKTRIACTLRELFGDGVLRIKSDQQTVTPPSNKKFEVNIIASNYHIEISPSDVGIHDRIVIQQLIKDIAQTQQIDASARHKFKVVIIDEAESLTREAQAALRRTMEKYMTNLRIILCCNTISRIIEPIRSRCLLIRVPAPTIDEITSILFKIAREERVNLPNRIARNIAESSNRNLRKAILTFETMHSMNENLNNNDEIITTDWERYIKDMSERLVKNSSKPEELKRLRNDFYDLINHRIPPATILKLEVKSSKKPHDMFVLIINLSDYQIRYILMIDLHILTIGPSSESWSKIYFSS
nr:11423_t:CDS:2 [Entrophospora candida]